MDIDDIAVARSGGMSGHAHSVGAGRATAVTVPKLTRPHRVLVCRSGVTPRTAAPIRLDGTMQVSARVDYGTRALVELTSVNRDEPNRLVKSEELAARQGIPPKFLEGILNQLRRSGFIASQRGADGGYRLARQADLITVADIIRALEGPLAAVRGEPPEDTEYAGPAGSLRDVWVATRASMRAVLEHVTLADIAAGHLPEDTASLLDQPGAWERR